MRKAYSQFQSICDYLVDEFGDSVADDFEFDVENCVAILRNFPESGHPEPIESKYQYRSKIVGQYNKMYYFLRGNTLVIAAFADMRMNPENLKRRISTL